MPVLDWIFTAVFLGSMLLGAWRGLVFEVLSVLGWVAAFFIAQWGAADMALWITPADWQAPLRHAAGFVALFVLSIFACGFVAWLAQKLIESIGLRPADRALGAIFGSVRGAVLLLSAAVVAAWTPLHQQAWWQQSQAAPVLSQLLQGLRPALPQEFGRYLPS